MNAMPGEAPDLRLFGRVYAPDDLGPCVITIAGDRIVAVDAADSPPTGVRSVPIIAPGFIDLQINGAFGEDFSDPAADLPAVCARLPRYGVTAFLPTVISSPMDRYAPCLANLSRSARDGEAHPVGVHLEGPFLNPDHAGTHDRDVLRAPAPDEARAWLEMGEVRIVTLAPELPGAVGLIEKLSGAGVVVAGGHTGASWAEAERAADAGMRLGTHLFNAMRPLHHRDPGIAGYLLASDVPVSVIADGRHLALETLSLVSAAKEIGGLIAVTDALAGLGMPPGDFLLAGRRVISDGTAASLPDGTLSGSVLPLPRMVANLVAAGLAPSAALHAVTASPARLLGMDREIGEVLVGNRADLAVLDLDWQPIETYIGGVRAWSAEADG